MNDPRPDFYVGKVVRFEAPFGNMGTVKFSGIVQEQRYLGPTQRGSIPDHELTVLGASGKTMKISLVENHCIFSQ